jgi:Fe-S-cluster containining protein
MSEKRRLLKRVAEIYNCLDLQTSHHSDISGGCSVCGRCCDFGKFDHLLYVTTPELMYLAAKIGDENIRPMAGRRCPYNVEGNCTVYENRFAGCRIFFCKADKDEQNRFSELSLGKFKALCVEFGVPYRYRELGEALSDFCG